MGRDRRAGDDELAGSDVGDRRENGARPRQSRWQVGAGVPVCA